MSILKSKKLNSESQKIEPQVKSDVTESVQNTDLELKPIKEVIKLEEKKPVIGPQGYLLKKPLTCDLRDGMILSMDKYNDLKSRGIDIDSYL